MRTAISRCCKGGERLGLFGSRAADSNELVRLCESVIGPVIGSTPERVPFTTRDALETAIGVAATKGAGTKRNPNKLVPVQDADGPHSSFRRDPNGRVSNYETYDKNPHNSQWTAAKRFRGSGKEHGGVEPPLVLERSEGKGPGSKPVVSRTPEPWELPKGY